VASANAIQISGTSTPSRSKVTIEAFTAPGVFTSWLRQESAKAFDAAQKINPPSRGRRAFERFLTTKIRSRAAWCNRRSPDARDDSDRVRAGSQTADASGIGHRLRRRVQD